MCPRSNAIEVSTIIIIFNSMWYIKSYRIVLLFPQHPQILVHFANDEYGYNHYYRPAHYRRNSQVHRFGGE